VLAVKDPHYRIIIYVKLWGDINHTDQTGQVNGRRWRRVLSHLDLIEPGGESESSGRVGTMRQTEPEGKN